MSKTGLVWTVAMGMAVLTCGCAHHSGSGFPRYAFKPVVPLTNEHFTAEGIPHKNYLVGGGIIVYFEAPTEGILYWVEEAGRKIIRTEAMESEEVFSEELPFDDEEFQRLFEDMSKTRFTLYFIPSAPAADSSASPDGSSPPALETTRP